MLLWTELSGSGDIALHRATAAQGEMPNESFSADRCRRSRRIGDNTHATGRGDADVAAGSRRCANRHRHRSGTRRPRSWSRAYGARRSWPSLRLGQRPRASLWMVTRQTSRLGLNPISPFAVVALVATTLGVKVGLQGPSAVLASFCRETHYSAANRVFLAIFPVRFCLRRTCV